jgi:fido (protein-threonine AMPylation protein)/DNA-binding transcriptional ArsR family regulator
MAEIKVNGQNISNTGHFYNIMASKLQKDVMMAHKSKKLAALAILKQLAEPVGISMLAARLGPVPARSLRRWLNAWVEEGVIEKSGQGRATRYRYCLAEADPTASLAFLAGLDSDLRQSLLKQLRDLWTHNSTAIEGNTLTLGDTHFVLEEGLTISGKPLKDHQEVIGHAKAIELLYQALSEPLSEPFIFNLHTAILTEKITDIYKPIGAWKVEANGTYAITEGGSQTFIEYALPVHVPGLMSELVNYVNSIDTESLNLNNAHQYYARIHMGIAHIHPFWDGNGRIARLLANLPLLKAGLPPLVIPQEQRREYIQALANYQISVGQLDETSGIWPSASHLEDFTHFCASIYSTTRVLVDNAHELQLKRNARS